MRFVFDPAQQVAQGRVVFIDDGRRAGPTVIHQYIDSVHREFVYPVFQVFGDAGPFFLFTECIHIFNHILFHQSEELDHIGVIGVAVLQFSEYLSHRILDDGLIQFFELLPACLHPHRHFLHKPFQFFLKLVNFLLDGSFFIVAQGFKFFRGNDFVIDQRCECVARRCFEH